MLSSFDYFMQIFSLIAIIRVIESNYCNGNGYLIYDYIYILKVYDLDTQAALGFFPEVYSGPCLYFFSANQYSFLFFLHFQVNYLLSLMLMIISFSTVVLFMLLHYTQ